MGKKMEETPAVRLKSFDKKYPRFQAPERLLLNEVLLDRYPWDETLDDFIDTLKKVRDEAIKSGKYISLGFEDDGSQSYDGSWYNLVGYYNETDKDYEERISYEREKYERKRARELASIQAEVEAERREYNRLADRNGWPRR